jgi:hypothetical protein
MTVIVTAVLARVHDGLLRAADQPSECPLLVLFLSVGHCSSHVRPTIQPSTVCSMLAFVDVAVTPRYSHQHR